jgi:hypothetical protein
VSGAGFGTKSTVAPFTWDNFEDGTTGNAVAGNHDWVEYAPESGTSHRYYATSCHGGSKCTQSIGSAAPYFKTIGKHDLSGDEIFYSLWVRWDRTAGTYTGAPVGKTIRINTQDAFYVGDGTGASFWWSSFENTEGGGDADVWQVANIYAPGDMNQQDLSAGPYAGGAWGRADVYVKLGTAGVANGEWQIWWNGTALISTANSTNQETRSTGVRPWENFLLPFMYDESGGTSVAFTTYVDDVYIDNTRSRIEICAGSTWASRGHCEIQIPSAWTASSATVTVNRGSFGVSDSAYLYVVDSTGSANSSGYAVTFGSGSNPVQSVTGCTIVGGRIQ